MMVFCGSPLIRVSVANDGLWSRENASNHICANSSPSNVQTITFVQTRRPQISGVARIFSVGGTGGPWVFVGGHQHFELTSPPPPPPPPGKKKSSHKKGPHFPAEQADKQATTKQEKKVITSVGMGSTVASFLAWGGGGGGVSPPNVPLEKIVTYMRERAPQKHIFRSQNTSAYIISTQFPFITYGMALLYDSIMIKHYSLRKIYDYASERA